MPADPERAAPAGRGDVQFPATVASRRAFIALLACGAATTLFPGLAAAAHPTLPKARRIRFHNLHTDERFDSYYCEHGAYVPEALAEIDTLLRDHRTGEVRRIEPRLIDLVFALTVRLGKTAPVQVISGYRSAATNALLRADDPGNVAASSLHLTGEAVDICFEGLSLRRVRDAALSLRKGGVGYYHASGLVHLDIGRPRRS